MSTAAAVEQTAPRPPFLAIAEVAALKGVSDVAVLYACRDGRLAGAFRLGRTWAIPEAALEGYSPRKYVRRPTVSARVPRD